MASEELFLQWFRMWPTVHCKERIRHVVLYALNSTTWSVTGIKEGCKLLFRCVLQLSVDCWTAPLHKLRISRFRSTNFHSLNLFFTKAPSLVLLYQHYVLLITQMFYVLHIYIHDEKEMLPLNLRCQDILNNHRCHILHWEDTADLSVRIIGHDTPLHFSCFF